jgi:hypothetical protein
MIKANRVNSKCGSHLYRWADLEKSLKGTSGIDPNCRIIARKALKSSMVMLARSSGPKKLQKVLHFLHAIGRIINAKPL